MREDEYQSTTAELLARIEDLEGRLGRRRRWHQSLRGRVTVAVGLAATLICGPSLASLAGAAPPQVFWSLTGNAGTNPSSNYLGTSDSQGLSIRTHGTQAISIDPSQNVSFAKTILGSINGTAGGFTGPLSGDVTGGQGTTKVVGLQGTGVSATPPTRDGQVLKYNLDHGTWEPGTDNSGLTAVNTGSGLTGDGTADHPLAVDYSAAQPHFTRTVVVSPDPNGSAASNGSKLLNAINGITDASATKHYLVHLEPGVYDLGSASLIMNRYVDVEGSGEDITTISSNPAQNGTVITQGDSGLSRLTIVSTADTGDDAGIQLVGGAPHLTQVTASGSFGAFAEGTSAMLKDVTLESDRTGGDALYSTGSTVTVLGSALTAPYGNAVDMGNDSTVHIATSQVAGTVVNGGASTIACVADYDASFAELDGSCAP